MNRSIPVILPVISADIHGQQIKWRASMEVKDMVGTIRLLMIFQVDPNHSINLPYYTYKLFNTACHSISLHGFRRR